MNRTSGLLSAVRQKSDADPDTFTGLATTYGTFMGEPAGLRARWIDHDPLRSV